MRCAMCVALGAMVVSSPAQAAPIITNGSFTGSQVVGFPPPGWTRVQATPDTVNEFGPFNNTGTPWTMSPDGGTFLRTNGVGNDQTEIVSQEISGFEVGHAYSFGFSLTNLGFESTAGTLWSGFDGYYQFEIDGSVIGNSVTVSKQANGPDPIVWTTDSVSFVATATTHTLSITPITVGTASQIAYLGIDGIGVSEVPAPGAGAGLAMVGLGLVGRRRRR